MYRRIELDNHGADRGRFAMDERHSVTELWGFIQDRNSLGIR